MKKTLLFYLNIIMFLLVYSVSAQTDISSYLLLEKNRIHKADSIESEITNYISKNIDLYKLSEQTILTTTKSLHEEHDGLVNPVNGEDLNKVLTQIKQNELRELYFLTNPNILSFFKATKAPNSLLINCINGGFENGDVANYSFKSILASATPIQHLEEGCSVFNNNGSFLPNISYNQYLDRSTLVTSGNEPFLAGLGINLNQVHSGNYALKINPNPIDASTLQIGNVTSVYRDFQIDGNTIDFSYLHFGYVVPSFSHIQPFFRYRVYSINNFGNITGVLREVCIPMDFINCKYVQVPDNRLGANTLSYTPNWVCEQINTSDLIGQNVRLEFTVSDCEFRGHFSSVYIDDLCGVSCPPTWGVIHLDNIDIDCPSVPFDVCGSFQLPDQSTLGSIVLNVLNQSGSVVATVINPVIDNQNFCFTVDPLIFGINPNENYTFKVISNLNNSSCVPTLTDTLGSVSFFQSVSPVFDQVLPICYGDAISDLPIMSNNGISGSWFPAINNMQTTTYTFTPNIETCATPTQMTIVVNQRITPSFNIPDFICYQDDTFSLPLISINAINGSWIPSFNNTQTTTYEFTPESGECANTAMIQIGVYEDFNFELVGYCDNKDYLIKISPLNNSFNPDMASYNWQVNNVTVDFNSVFNVSNYLRSTAIVEVLPVIFDVTITNSNGCIKTKSITVGNVFCGIQKGISPNNNDYLNDYFDLRLLNVKHLNIFNRYGMKVYNKANYYDEWIGQSDNGQELPDGVYYYQIEFNDKPSKTGWIYICRETK